jgi:hypothetical protein
MDSRDLGLGGGDRDNGIRIYSLDLAVDTLDHRFVFTVGLFEDLDELL